MKIKKILLPTGAVLDALVMAGLITEDDYISGWHQFFGEQEEA